MFDFSMTRVASVSSAYAQHHIHGRAAQVAMTNHLWNSLTAKNDVHVHMGAKVEPRAQQRT